MLNVEHIHVPLVHEPQPAADMTDVEPLTMTDGLINYLNLFSFYYFIIVIIKIVYCPFFNRIS